MINLIKYFVFENTYLLGQGRKLMSGNPPSNPDINAVKDEIIIKLTKLRRPIIIDSCLDLMLSQINSSFDMDLNTMFEDYFNRTRHYPLLKDPDLTWYFVPLCDRTTTQAQSQGQAQSQSQSTDTKDQTSSKKSEDKSIDMRAYNDDTSCCLPCSCITLNGKRAIKELLRPHRELIKSMQLPDVIYNYFISKADIDQIGDEILNDLQFKNTIKLNYYTVPGMISQVMINEINKGMSSRTIIRNSTALKSIGLKQNKNFDRPDLSDMQRVPAMDFAIQAVVQFKHFYDFRSVILNIEKIAGAYQNIAPSIPAIIDLIRNLKRSSESFDYGTNAYDTLKETAWHLAKLYLVKATAPNVPLNEQRLDELVDAHRRRLELKNVPNLSKTKTQTWFDLGRDFRDFILHLLAPDLSFWNDETKVRALIDMDELLVERIIASFKEATGINLADKRWLTEKVVVSSELPSKL